MASILLNLSALLFFMGIRLALPLKKYQALLEEIAALKCNIDDWNTFHTIVWNKDEELIVRLSSIDRLSENGKYNVTRDSDAYVLRVLNVQFQDAGIYECVSYYTSISNNVHRDEFELQVQGNPRLLNDEPIFTEGDVVAQSCCVNITATFELPTIYLFIENDENFESYTESEEELSTNFPTHNELCSEISFLGNRRQHGKRLTCLVRNQLNVTDVVIFKVLYPASVSLQVSDFHVTENHGYTIKENSNMEITCESDANPPTNTTLERKTHFGWNFLRADLSSSFQNDTIVFNVYILHNVTRSFSGYYRCVTTNNISHFAVGAIEILYAPEISLKTTSVVQTPLGGNISIECEVDSNPLPDVKLQKSFIDNSWVTLHEIPIFLSNRSTISTWRFQFSNINEKVSGLYRCFASNGVGSMALTKTVNVTVLKSDSMPVKDENQSEIFFIFFTLVVVISAFIVTATALIYNRKTRTSQDSFEITASTRIARRTDCAGNIYPDVVTMPRTIETFCTFPSTRALPEKPTSTDNNYGKDTINRPWNRTSLESASSEGLHSLHLDSSGYATVNEKNSDCEYADMNRTHLEN